MAVLLNEYVDPKTGEKVKKCPIPEFHQKDIEASLNKHNQNMNNMFAVSQQLFGVIEAGLQARKTIVESEKEIKEKLQFACKKLGINHQDPWNYNIVEKVFEMREPPIAIPLSANLVDGYDIESIKEVPSAVKRD